MLAFAKGETRTFGKTRQTYPMGRFGTPVVKPVFDKLSELRNLG